MGDIASILAKKNFSEPPEISAIKAYVNQHFKADITVSVRDDAFILTAKSSALAATLRMNSQQIIESCGITKKLIFKIG